MASSTFFSSCFSNDTKIGEQAYLRTQQILEEATAVSDILFADDADMARRRQRVYAREDALDAAAAHPWRSTMSPSSLFGNAPFSAGPGKGSSAGVVGFGDITLAPGPGRGLGQKAAAERRPEERRCCDAFLNLKDLLVRSVRQTETFHELALSVVISMCVPGRKLSMATNMLHGSYRGVSQESTEDYSRMCSSAPVNRPSGALKRLTGSRCDFATLRGVQRACIYALDVVK